MIKLSNISVPAKAGEAALWSAVSQKCGCRVAEGKILKKSVDARDKGDVRLVYTVAFNVRDERAVLKKCRGTEEYCPREKYRFPYRCGAGGKSPVVVGLGPAGLFAAYCLCLAGIKPVILEQGEDVYSRAQAVESFWSGGELNELSNVQFGEGGAGTFSDGKLTTGIRDRRIDFVNDTFVKFGAPEDILYLKKPHIGTDRLRGVVYNMRREIEAMGGRVEFSSRLVGLCNDQGAVTGCLVRSGEKEYAVETDSVLLFPGNSARDTFYMLDRAGVQLSCKSFSAGVRIEHLQRDIDMAQYGEAADYGTLPASDYKLAVHLENGRTVYTFCVCPGGKVVAAASEKGGIVTNGMSEYARDYINCNGGLLVTLTPEDFGGDWKKAVEFQRGMERSAFLAGGEDYSAPCQLVGDFMKKVPSKGPRGVYPAYRPGVNWCSLWDVLPEFICESIKSALPEMGRKVRGFDSPEAVLTCVESRSSSPVRIDRGEDFQSVSLSGLFPGGEGAGYAGGIMSAAVDGIAVAEAYCREKESRK